MKLDFSELLQPQGSEPARKLRETAPAAATDSTQAIITALTLLYQKHAERLTES